MLKTLDILGKYSLMYSPSTRVAKYSDSTALPAIFVHLLFTELADLYTGENNQLYVSNVLSGMGGWEQRRN